MTARTRSVWGLVFDRPYVLLTLTMLFWGGNAVAGKMAVGEVSPMALTSLRWFTASIILGVLARTHLASDAPTIQAHWRLLALLGGAGLGLFSVLLYTALNFTTAVNVSIEQAAIPIFIIILNFAVYRAPVGPMPLVGIVLTLIGVAIVASHGDLASLLALRVNIGDALMVAGGFVYAGYSVALRGRPKLHWLSFLTMLTAAAALATSPAFVWELWTGRFVFTAEALLIFAYIVIFPSILAQLFYARGVELIGANRAGLFSNFVPVFGALLAVVLLGEAFRLYHLAAFAFVLAGVLLAERHRDRPWRWAGRMRG